MKNIGQQFDAPVAVSSISLTLTSEDGCQTLQAGKRSYGYLHAGVLLHIQNFRRQLVQEPTGTTCEHVS